jgi:hypothetical protein
MQVQVLFPALTSNWGRRRIAVGKSKASKSGQFDRSREAFYKLLLGHRLYGNLAAKITAFGDEIALRQQYKKHHGIDAVHYYLVTKFNWMPSQVRALNTEDLIFLLQEEMADWNLPDHLADVVSDPPRRTRRASSGP